MIVVCGISKWIYKRSAYCCAFVVVWYRSILTIFHRVHWNWGNYRIAQVPVKQTWKICKNESYKSTKNPWYVHRKADHRKTLYIVQIIHKFASHIAIIAATMHPHTDQTSSPTAKYLGSPSSIHRCDIFASDRCLTNVDPKVLLFEIPASIGYGKARVYPTELAHGFVMRCYVARLQFTNMNKTWPKVVAKKTLASSAVLEDALSVRYIVN